MGPPQTPPREGQETRPLCLPEMRTPLSQRSPRTGGICGMSAGEWVPWASETGQGPHSRSPRSVRHHFSFLIYLSIPLIWHNNNNYNPLSMHIVMHKCIGKNLLLCFMKILDHVTCTVEGPSLPPSLSLIIPHRRATSTRGIPKPEAVHRLEKVGVLKAAGVNRAKV